MIQPNANMQCFKRILQLLRTNKLVSVGSFIYAPFDISKAILIQALNEQPSTKKK